MKSSNIHMAMSLLRERDYMQQFIDNASVPAEEHGDVTVGIGGEEIDIPSAQSHVIVVDAARWATARLAEIVAELAALGVEIDDADAEDDMQEAA